MGNAILMSQNFFLTSTFRHKRPQFVHSSPSPSLFPLFLFLSLSLSLSHTHTHTLSHCSFLYLCCSKAFCFFNFCSKMLDLKAISFGRKKNIFLVKVYRSKGLTRFLLMLSYPKIKYII